MNINSLDSLKEHSSIITQKKQLNILYKYFYRMLLSGFQKKQKVIEIGSGGGFVKVLRPTTITSDVLAAPGIDKVFMGEKIPYKNKSLDGIIMLNVFHHIKNPEIALKEMNRVLKPGGKIVMVEPWNSLWSRFIYTHFHHEKFNPHSKSWKIKGNGRMSDANGANPWIIFVRDSSIFKKRFATLRVTKVYPHTPLSYLLTGGLSKPSLIPVFLLPFILKMEEKILNKIILLPMFVTICIQKKK